MTERASRNNEVQDCVRMLLYTMYDFAFVVGVLTESSQVFLTVSCIARMHYTAMAEG